MAYSKILILLFFVFFASNAIADDIEKDIFSNISNTILDNMDDDNPESNDVYIAPSDYSMDQYGNTMDGRTMPALKARFKSWYVLMGYLDDNPVCYAFAKPVTMIGNHTADRDPYIMVIYKTPKVQELNIRTGYIFKKNSRVNVSVDGLQYEIQTNGYFASPPNIAIDRKIIYNMLLGRKIMAKGTSAINTYSVDLYSLDGFEDAYKEMNNLCG